MSLEITQLPDDLTLLKQLILELQEQLKKSRRSEEQLRFKIDELVRKLFGRQSEKIDPNQLQLLDLEGLGIEKTEAPSEPTPEAKKPLLKRRGHGRRRPAKELSRRRIEHTLPEAERLCPCCGLPMGKIREQIHEQLDYEPASLHVVEHARFLYGCSKGCDEALATAPKPPQLIEKGLPGPGLLAHVATSKYGDHLPLYRLEKIFRRQGVDIARSTMCDWIRAISDQVEPLVNFLHQDLKQSFDIATDDTPVPVQKKGGTYKGRLWVYIGDASHPWVVFDYTPTRQRAGPAEFLKGYQGFLQADAYTGYDGLFEDLKILEVACWMHARRYFYKAAQADPTRPCEALAIIRELYKIERRCRAECDEKRYEIRQREAVPLLKTFDKWIQDQSLKALPKSPLGQALGYASNQWKALCRYTTDGRLSIDNGRSERALRPVAVGRKNWLFAGSDAGGTRAARLYTLIGTCQYHHLDPFAYLRDLLDQLPSHPKDRIHELTPTAWAERQSKLPKTVNC